MSPRSLVVSEIGTQGPFQMRRVEDDEMVQAIPADLADQASEVGILPGTPGGVAARAISQVLATFIEKEPASPRQTRDIDEMAAANPAPAAG